MRPHDRKVWQEEEGVFNYRLYIKNKKNGIMCFRYINFQMESIEEWYLSLSQKVDSIEKCICILHNIVIEWMKRIKQTHQLWKCANQMNLELPTKQINKHIMWEIILKPILIVTLRQLDFSQIDFNCSQLNIYT